MPSLFDPFTLRSVTLRNRVGVSPMCMYSSDEGFATDFHLAHLGSFAMGGAGLVMTEATAVSPEGRITPRCAGIWSDDHVEGWARAVRYAKSHGGALGMQLAHAGRKASMAPPHSWEGQRGSVGPDRGGWTPIGPTDQRFDSRHATPRAMTGEDIARVKGAFVDSTKRALDAGFDAIEIHAAHGYLMHQFFSPLTNTRTDPYGGESFDSRVRLLVETAREVRRVWPERLPLMVRLSCSDWVGGAWDIEQSVEVCRRLRDEGVDLIDCSSGFVAPGIEHPFAPGWQVPFAERIRRGAGVPTAAVGEITTPAQAAAIVGEGQADVVFLGRAMLRDPHFAWRASKEITGRSGGAPLAAQYEYAVG